MISVAELSYSGIFSKIGGKNMNKDMINRLKTAAGYQKKAIMALLPESTAGHLEVIGKEMKQMFAELMIKGVADAAKQDKDNAVEDKAPQSKAVKKVDIV